MKKQSYGHVNWKVQKEISILLVGEMTSLVGGTLANPKAPPSSLTLPYGLNWPYILTGRSPWYKGPNYGDTGGPVFLDDEPPNP
jgi:hypothetical protein